MHSNRHHRTGEIPGAKPRGLPALAVSLLLTVGVCTSVRSEDFAAADTMRADLNLMTAPSSPAFTLLGTEPASVPRPTDRVSFVITILNATDGLSRLPDDFAMEFTPYWIFWDKKFYGEDATDRSTLARLWSNIRHSATVSLGTTSRTDTIAGETEETSTLLQSTSLGVGLAFTILPGKLDTGDTDYVRWYNGLVDSVRDVEKYLSRELNARLADDNLVTILDQKIFDGAMKLPPYRDSLKNASTAGDSLGYATELRLLERELDVLKGEKNLRNETLKRELQSKKGPSLDWIRKHVSEQPNRRIGWTAALAGGAVFDFPGRMVQDGRLTRWGAWTTVGYSSRKLTLLTLGRALGNDQTSDNVSLDFGGRFIVDSHKKVSFSVEGVYRSFPNREGDLDKSTWRIAFQADYAIAKNKSISATLGRDFSGERTGNVITLVNLVMGFGSNRSLEN